MVVAVPDTGKGAGRSDQFRHGPDVARPGGQGLQGQIHGQVANRRGGAVWSANWGSISPTTRDWPRARSLSPIVPVDHAADPEEHYAAVFLLDAGDHAAQLATNLARGQEEMD